MRLPILTRIGLIGGAVVGLGLVVSTISLALHRFTPPFVQVTEQTSGEVGRISAYSAELYAFEASGDVLANGNAGWQIFLFDLTLRDYAGEQGITQLTFGPHGARHPSISKQFMSNPVLIAFEADGSLCADPAHECELGAPTSGRQVFLYHTGTRRITQVTRGPGDCRNPSISGNGLWVVFDSTTDLLGSGQIGTVPELYLGELSRLGESCTHLPCPGAGEGGPGLERMTTGGGQHGVLSFNGLTVAFESSADLLQTGEDAGVQHVYVLRRRNNALKQITSGPQEARAPSLSANGRKVGYEQDVIPSEGGAAVSQIFVSKVTSSRRARRPRRRSPVTQVTNASAPSFAPSISPNGRRVAFTSAADLLGAGSQGNQVFTQNLRRRGVLTQLTNGAIGADSPAQTTAVIVAFASSDDFTGTGNQTPQLFVANYFEGAPSDFVSPFPGTPTPVPTPDGSATPTPMPTPNACASAVPVPASGGNFNGSTAGTSTHAGSCNAGDESSPEQVFEWTPAASGTATIHTCGAETLFDTVVYMRAKACSTGPEVACNDDTAGCETGEPSAFHGSTITPMVLAGETYFIFVDGFNGSAGQFTLTITPP